MTPEELQNQINKLKDDLDSFKDHDHFFTGGRLFLQNQQNFGYYKAEILLQSGDATIATRYDRFFTADYDLEIVGAEAVYRVKAGSADTLDVYKVTSGQATLSGTSVLSGTIALDSTANTPLRKTASTNRSNRILKRGDGLALINSGTLASLDHLKVDVYYLPFGVTPKF